MQRSPLPGLCQLRVAFGCPEGGAPWWTGAIRPSPASARSRPYGPPPGCSASRPVCGSLRGPTAVQRDGLLSDSHTPPQHGHPTTCGPFNSSQSNSAQRIMPRSLHVVSLKLTPGLGTSAQAELRQELALQLVGHPGWTPRLGSLAAKGIWDRGGRRHGARAWDRHSALEPLVATLCQPHFGPQSPTRGPCDQSWMQKNGVGSCP